MQFKERSDACRLIRIEVGGSRERNLGWRSVRRPQQVAVCLSPWHHVSISQPWQATHLTFVAHCVATEDVLFSVMLDKLLLSHRAHNGHGRSSHKPKLKCGHIFLSRHLHKFLHFRWRTILNTSNMLARYTCDNAAKTKYAFLKGGQI